MIKQILLLFLLLPALGTAIYSQDRPNVLLILADDLGVDALSAYEIGSVLPHTPNIDKLCKNGLTFTNMWAAPACAPTRATILTGKYGCNSGINTVPGILKPTQKSLFKEIKELTGDAYEISVIGKWHNGVESNIEHPIAHGANDFMGVIGAGVDDYYDWTKVENHESSQCTTYATSYFTDYAASWIKQQTKPWFMWFAHVAPHTPFHVPPAGLYSRSDVSTNQYKYMAMIEAMDYEIGRLFDSIPESVLENTVVLFVGDNGTPGNIIQEFPNGKGKNTVYQGGVNVPFVASGRGVARVGQREDAMINASDFYATIAQLVQPGALPGDSIHDSYGFSHLFVESMDPKRKYNYMELGANSNVPADIYTLRNQRYKIIYDVLGNKEMYDLLNDPFELNNLLSGELSAEELAAKEELEAQMYAINSLSFEDNETDTTTLPGVTAKYAIVDTDVKDFYSEGALISEPLQGEPFYGQDAHYSGNQSSYTDNGDGTISDNITGLMWEQSMGEKITFEEAFTKASNSKLGGYTDWRVPTIKELYSLILFSGQVKGESAIKLFIDTRYFEQALGDVSAGEREIDAQTWSATEYVGKTMNADATVFGVNFIDGRIKGYPKLKPRTGSANTMYFRMVRGNTDYGKNILEDNNNNTISDLATGLMWQKADDGIARNWEEALSYAEALELGGYTDWRLPNAKELQSIVDYNRSSQTTNSPAIDPLFSCTEINDPDGNPGHYPFYWTGTTHMDGVNPYSAAVYVAFGEGLGKMNDKLMDVHGAGCQRSDPKSGNKEDYPKYFGPQGDVQYVYNYVRCVRDISVSTSKQEIKEIDFKMYPNPASESIFIEGKNRIAQITVYSITGQKLLETMPGEKRTQLIISGLLNGLYLIVVHDELEQLSTQKFVVKH